MFLSLVSIKNVCHYYQLHLHCSCISHQLCAFVQSNVFIFVCGSECLSLLNQLYVFVYGSKCHDVSPNGCVSAGKTCTAVVPVIDFVLCLSACFFFVCQCHNVSHNGYVSLWCQQNTCTAAVPLINFVFSLCNTVANVIMVSAEKLLI